MPDDGLSEVVETNFQCDMVGWNSLREYPYGTLHTWDMSRYKKQLLPIDENQRRFPVIYRYDSENTAQTALTQAQVQDVFFLVQDAHDLAKEKVRVRYITANPEGHRHDEVFAVIDASFKINPEYQHSLSRLLKPGSHATLVFPSETKPADSDKETKEHA